MFFSAYPPSLPLLRDSLKATASITSWPITPGQSTVGTFLTGRDPPNCGGDALDLLNARSQQAVLHHPMRLSLTRMLTTSPLGWFSNLFRHEPPVTYNLKKYQSHQQMKSDCTWSVAAPLKTKLNALQTLKKVAVINCRYRSGIAETAVKDWGGVFWGIIFF